MSYGPTSKFSKSIASGVTLTGGFDLARSWKYVYLEVPTMASGTDFYIQGSSDNSTFRRVQFVGDSTAKHSQSLASAATLTGAYDLGEGAKNPHVLIPTLATGTSILVHGSLDNSAFRKVTLPVPNTATIQNPTDFSIGTMTVSRLVPIPEGFRYVKLELATGVTDATSTFEIIATRPNVQQDFKIASSTSQRFVPIPAAFRYLKVELSTAMTDTTSTFNLVCSD